jgi:HD-like signal output (HDOD) protein
MTASGTPAQQGRNAPVRRRRELSPPEVESLYARLEQRLQTTGVETQPQVAARILELAQNPATQLKDYADAIRADWNITGRVLRMANSAFYAQRQPVTKLERALVVLGTERTKAIALGFYLSRLAATGIEREFSRRVWGESVYRGALCSQLAKVHCPQLAGEAFIVGLMLDCALPMMPGLAGAAYAELYAEAGSPGKLFALEYDRLEQTHVDVFAVLARRWKLPRLLVRPVLWHHTLPPVGASSDPTVLLHRLAYYAGSIQLSPQGVPKQEAPQASVANRLFEISSDNLATACREAASEYDSLLAMFDDVAGRMGDMESVTDAVRVQLVELLDEQFARALRMETRGGVERYSVAGQIVEVEPGRVGEVAAYITTEAGQRLLSCTVNPMRDGPEVIARLLGLEDVPAQEMGDLVRVMRAIAA